MPGVDAIKAIASQLIVWHHLAFYGPMSDVVYPRASGIIHWLYSEARIAVQAFLVVGGFLAYRSLSLKIESGQAGVPALIWQRYRRLARPYVIALAAALAAGLAARAWMDHPAVPHVPTVKQIFANLFFLQDIAGEEALSAGVWYVAIDFQLYVLLALILRYTGRAAVAVCAALAAVSLFWLNRISALDAWAPYFFGAYGLGILAAWISSRPRRIPLSIALAALVSGALLVDWRERIVVAGCSAVALALSAGGAPRWAAAPPIAALGRISYSVFLIHYPVCLTVNALVFRLWPESWTANALGLVSAWLLSLACGALLYRVAEFEPERKPAAELPERTPVHA